MKTPIAIAALTLMFLSAGAVASIGHNHLAARNAVDQNVTVIGKNMPSPVFAADPA